MPRGTRAIHGAEVTGDHHASGQPDGTFIQVVEPWLAITCWCERHVVQIEQALFRELGVTYSCGAPDCVAPDGDRSETPMVLAEQDVRLASGITERNGWGEAVQFGGSTATPTGKPKPKRQLTRERRKGYVTRIVAPSKRRRERTPRELVTARRDRVEQMYLRGVPIPEIAGIIDEPYHTAMNDVQWLRRTGRVT